MGLPFTVEPGDVIRLSRFDHVTPDGSRFTYASRDRKRVYVLLLLGLEDKKGEHPLDGEQVLNAMGWIKDPEKWESEDEAVGSKQLTAEELLTPLKAAEERYAALAADVRAHFELAGDGEIVLDADTSEEVGPADAIFEVLKAAEQEARP